VPEVADVDFPIVLRGYDRTAVDAYIKRTSQLVAELSASRSPQAAVRRALERVGEDVSGILQRAHDTAEQITAASRREAEDRLEAARREAETLLVDARQQAEDTVAGAQHRLTELDAETDRIWSERHRIVEDARTLAAQLLALAEAAVERFPAAESQADEQGAGSEAPLTVADPLTGEEEFGGPEDLAEDEEDMPEGLGYAEDEEDTGELTEAYDSEEETAVHPTTPFDGEAESSLPGDGEEEATQNTLPLDHVEPGDDDLREHDAE
jgi:cell division septum initiation protein DivIVA